MLPKSYKNGTLVTFHEESPAHYVGIIVNSVNKVHGTEGDTFTEYKIQKVYSSLNVPNFHYIDHFTLERFWKIYEIS